MKRVALFLGLMLLSALLGGVVAAALQPAPGADERKMDWLAEQLALTPAQRAKLLEIHGAHCPKIGRLGAAACAMEGRDTRQQCREATARLVAAVSAELTPLQRERYLELVSSCLLPADLPRHP